jgi:putative two-component system response regulator
VGEAAPLHDIGKVAIPDAVLLKRGPLSKEEFEVIKTHAVVGAHILSGGQSELLRLAEEIAYTHHERWEGSGYPRGLAGTDIPLAGRLVAVVDVYDALTSTRPYKHAWPVDRAVAEMRSQRGRHFDPEVLDVFLALDGLG